METSIGVYMGLRATGNVARSAYRLSTLQLRTMGRIDRAVYCAERGALAAGVAWQVFHLQRLRILANLVR